MELVTRQFATTINSEKWCINLIVRLLVVLHIQRPFH